MPVLNTLLRRRMLVTYLVTVLAMYAAAVAAAFGLPDARGEWVAVALSTLGLLAALPRHLRGWRYAVSVLCACLAPLAPVLGHHELAAQVWALIPVTMIAVYIRSWHRPATARLLTGALAAGITLCLWLAPAPAPALWFVLFPACILGSAELFGLLISALVEAALRDPLTAVWNRAGLSRELAGLQPRARRRGESLAVIVLDIDDFKAVNDRDGHAAGDSVLIQLTRRWTRQLPPCAVLGRIGGDEFVAVLTGCTEGRARTLADALGGTGPVHVSTGVAVGPAHAPNSFTALLTEADRDLYRHKTRRKARRSRGADPQTAA